MYLDRTFSGEKFREVIDFHQNSRNLYALLSFNPIYVGEKTIGVSLFVEDITELNYAQLVLKEYNGELSILVKKRTSELEIKNKDLENVLGNLKSTQDQLIQSEKMASLGLLSAGIGHELNNPLNFILHGFNSLVQETSNLIPDRVN
jgi:C4-dicarboxylate-specific signal transduction histidine kinase